MNTFKDLIEQFMYKETPFNASSTARFEAIAATVLGSKQRRYGPLPSPEIQVSIRDILRRSGDEVQFFLPWGSRKQHDGQGVDVMEFMAIKQLACLQSDLRAMGVRSTFTFRIEDITDYWLFNYGPSKPQVDKYAADLKSLITSLLEPGTTKPQLETELTTWEDFKVNALDNQALFLNYFDHDDQTAFAKLNVLGWQGQVTPAQREHYFRQYRQYGAESQDELNAELAKYLASALARTQVNARGLPSGEFIFITFGHPVPDNPNAPNRLFYRTIPEKYTNNHRSPWLAKGYVVVGEDNTVTPKSLGFTERLDLIENSITVNGVEVQADYILA